MAKDKYPDEYWSKDDEIGNDPKFSRKAPIEVDQAIDEAMGLQPITMRLQKTLVEDLKTLARQNGLGYQPFVRQILTQYVREQKNQKS